jgi:hypothetical protein
MDTKISKIYFIRGQRILTALDASFLLHSALHDVRYRKKSAALSDRANFFDCNSMFTARYTLSWESLRYKDSAEQVKWQDWKDSG